MSSSFVGVDDADYLGWNLLARAPISPRFSPNEPLVHWKDCARLAQRFPTVRVEPDPIYVCDGGVWTSAGVTAGIDLALALLEEDLGRSMALAVARFVVVFLKRPGGQAQFSAALALQAATTGSARFTTRSMSTWPTNSRSRPLLIRPA
jgi:hypothetical protein